MKNYILKILLIASVVHVFSSCTTDDSSFIDDLPDAIIDTDRDGDPPRGMHEGWNGHSEELYRQYFDQNVAIYYDNEVERPLEWPYEFVSDAWGHIVLNYADYDEDDRLFAIFHAEGDGAFSSTRFDAETSNRHLIDIPLNDLEMTSANTDMIVREMSSVLENSAFGVSSSPAEDVWQDKFAEIIMYDVYNSLEMETEAQRVMEEFSATAENFPAENSFWFRDWFYPIYDNYAGSITLNNFFRIASETYPLDGSSYMNEMDMGELVHFFSGATGEDLQPLAEEAFGWSEAWQDELIDARTNFPNLNYPFEPTSVLIDLTTDATLTVSKDNDAGPDSNEGSLKLIDGDTDSKFLTGGFPGAFPFWMQQELPTAQVMNRYTITSGNDAPERDPTDWELQASNDGTTWEVLDTQTDQEWTQGGNPDDPGRNATREFEVDNETAYTYYRLYVTENAGSDAVQISEWRLLNFELAQPAGPEDLTGEATLTVEKDNNDGPTGNEGSLKLIDGDINTKFLVGRLPDDFTTWWQQEFAEAKVVNRYSITSGNDASERDPTDWELQASNDGTTWEVLDTRSGEAWLDGGPDPDNNPGRNRTREFAVDNDQAYTHYRLFITENYGTSDAVQVSEWRLLNAD